MNHLPAQVGRYRIERELVCEEDLRRWSAVDTQNDTPVEILAPRAHVLLREGAREGFESLELAHPAAMPVLARMEVDGVPLRVRAATQGTLAGVALSPDQALALARWLIPAILAGGGMFGGELRPEDIVVDAGGTPRLAAIRLPRPESLARVPYHRAPEVVAGGVPDAAADLFGLGVLLYRAVTGAEPFPADSVQQLKLRRLPALPLSEHLDVHPDLEQLVGQLLSLDPSQRVPGDLPAEVTPPTLVVSLDHDAPARAAVVRSGPPEEARWVVLVPLKGRKPADLRRIALRSGVTPEAVEKAAARGGDWVLDTAETEGEATRLARRHDDALRVRVQGTSAPDVARYGLMALATLACAFFLPGVGVWIAVALFGVLLWRVLGGFREGVRVAGARFAWSERLRSPAAGGAEGRAWALGNRLREADHLPAPLRAELREAIEGVTERLEVLAVQEVEVARGAGAADVAASIREERERLGRNLARLEMELTRTSAAAVEDPESPAVTALGRMARELRPTGR